MRTLIYFDKILRTWKNGVRWTVWAQMENYENGSPTKQTTIHLNFLLEQHWVGGSRRIQGSGYYYWPSLKENCVVAKANRILGLIKITCKGLRSLYCSFGMYNLEYCSVLFSPFSRNNIDKLEGVQRRATKFILKAKDSYETILSLENRRVDVSFTKCTYWHWCFTIFHSYIFLLQLWLLLLFWTSLSSDVKEKNMQGLVPLIFLFPSNRRLLQYFTCGYSCSTLYWAFWI